MRCMPTQGMMCCPQCICVTALLYRCSHLQAEYLKQTTARGCSTCGSKLYIGVLSYLLAGPPLRTDVAAAGCWSEPLTILFGP